MILSVSFGSGLQQHHVPSLSSAHLSADLVHIGVGLTTGFRVIHRDTLEIVERGPRLLVTHRISLFCVRESQFLVDSATPE